MSTDDLSVPGVHAVGKRERVTPIPAQGVEALRDAFQQAMRDAGGQPDDEAPGEGAEDPSDRPEPDEEVPPPPRYDAHGRLLEPPRLDLEV